MRRASCFVVLLTSLVVVAPPVEAQAPFLSWDFADGGLDDFFNPIAVNFSACSATFPAIPSGTAEVVDGEVLLTNSSLFGINLLLLRPDVAAASFPESRDFRARLRVKFETASQLGVSVKTRIGFEEDLLQVVSDFERTYTVSVFPELASESFPAGAISVVEFTSCHGPVEHPEWPGAEERGFVLMESPVPILREEWYWVEVDASGDEDGGPVTIAVKVWPQDDEPPAEPIVTVVDPDGLPLDEETRAPEMEAQFGVSVSLDYPDPRDANREPNGTLRVDDITLTSPGGVGPSFRRGDSDVDGAIAINDAVFVLNYLFLGGGAPACPDAADGNGNNSLDLTDAVFILNYLFLGGGAPPAPGVECGTDPDEDTLDECSYDRC